MKDEGLGGAFLMPIRSAKERPEYGGDADALTPKFWDMAAYAAARPTRWAWRWAYTSAMALHWPEDRG